MSEPDAWKRCSSCKKPIKFRDTYYLCNVSTCRRKRTGFFFCTVECWEAHLPMMRHRDAWAEEETAPSREEWRKQQDAEAGERKPKPTAAPAKQANPAPTRRRRVIGADAGPDVPKEILVVASRFKNYVKARYDFNTSDSVFDVLSDELRRVADRAVENARADGRKTVLDRDFDWLKR